MNVWAESSSIQNDLGDLLVGTLGITPFNETDMGLLIITVSSHQVLTNAVRKFPYNSVNPHANPGYEYFWILP